MKFEFKLFDDEAKYFCEQIVKEMVILHLISEAEALKRVNSHWCHLEIVGGEEELIYHEEPKYWAHDIYYGSDSYWWLTKEKRKEMGLPRLVGKVLTNA